MYKVPIEGVKDACSEFEILALDGGAWVYQSNSMSDIGVL
jgi:hypothetical protein